MERTIFFDARHKGQAPQLFGLSRRVLFASKREKELFEMAVNRDYGAFLSSRVSLPEGLANETLLPEPFYGFGGNKDYGVQESVPLGSRLVWCTVNNVPLTSTDTLIQNEKDFHSSRLNALPVGCMKGAKLFLRVKDVLTQCLLTLHFKWIGKKSFYLLEHDAIHPAPEEAVLSTKRFSYFFDREAVVKTYDYVDKLLLENSAVDLTQQVAVEHRQPLREIFEELKGTGLASVLTREEASDMAFHTLPEKYTALVQLLLNVSRKQKITNPFEIHIYAASIKEPQWQSWYHGNTWILIEEINVMRIPSQVQVVVNETDPSKRVDLSAIRPGKGVVFLTKGDLSTDLVSSLTMYLDGQKFVNTEQLLLTDASASLFVPRAPFFSGLYVHLDYLLFPRETEGALEGLTVSEFPVNSDFDGKTNRLYVRVVQAVRVLVHPTSSMIPSKHMIPRNSFTSESDKSYVTYSDGRSVDLLSLGETPVNMYGSGTLFIKNDRLTFETKSFQTRQKSREPAEVNSITQVILTTGEVAFRSGLGNYQYSFFDAKRGTIGKWVMDLLQSNTPFSAMYKRAKLEWTNHFQMNENPTVDLVVNEQILNIPLGYVLVDGAYGSIPRTSDGSAWSVRIPTDMELRENARRYLGVTAKAQPEVNFDVSLIPLDRNDLELRRLRNLIARQGFPVFTSYTTIKGIHSGSMRVTPWLKDNECRKMNAAVRSIRSVGLFDFYEPPSTVYLTPNQNEGPVQQVKWVVTEMARTPALVLACCLTSLPMEHLLSDRDLYQSMEGMSLSDDDQQKIKDYNALARSFESVRERFAMGTKHMVQYIKKVMNEKKGNISFSQWMEGLHLRDGNSLQVVAKTLTDFLLAFRAPRDFIFPTGIILPRNQQTIKVFMAFAHLCSENVLLFVEDPFDETMSQTNACDSKILVGKTVATRGTWVQLNPFMDRDYTHTIMLARSGQLFHLTSNKSHVLAPDVERNNVFTVYQVGQIVKTPSPLLSSQFVKWLDMPAAHMPSEDQWERLSRVYTSVSSGTWNGLVRGVAFHYRQDLLGEKVAPALDSMPDLTDLNQFLLSARFSVETHDWFRKMKNKLYSPLATVPAATGRDKVDAKQLHLAALGLLLSRWPCRVVSDVGVQGIFLPWDGKMKKVWENVPAVFLEEKVANDLDVKLAVHSPDFSYVPGVPLADTPLPKFILVHSNNTSLGEIKVRMRLGYGLNTHVSVYSRDGWMALSDVKYDAVGVFCETEYYVHGFFQEEENSEVKYSSHDPVYVPLSTAVPDIRIRLGSSVWRDVYGAGYGVSLKDLGNRNVYAVLYELRGWSSGERHSTEHALTKQLRAVTSDAALRKMDAFIAQDVDFRDAARKPVFKEGTFAEPPPDGDFIAEKKLSTDKRTNPFRRNEVASLASGMAALTMTGAVEIAKEVKERFQELRTLSERNERQIQAVTSLVEQALTKLDDNDEVLKRIERGITQSSSENKEGHRQILNRLERLSVELQTESQETRRILKVDVKTMTDLLNDIQAQSQNLATFEQLSQVIEKTREETEKYFQSDAFLKLVEDTLGEASAGWEEGMLESYQEGLALMFDTTVQRSREALDTLASDANNSVTDMKAKVSELVETLKTELSNIDVAPIATDYEDLVQQLSVLSERFPGGEDFDKLATDVREALKKIDEKNSVPLDQLSEIRQVVVLLKESLKTFEDSNTAENTDLKVEIRGLVDSLKRCRREKSEIESRLQKNKEQKQEIQRRLENTSNKGDTTKLRQMEEELDRMKTSLSEGLKSQRDQISSLRSELRQVLQDTASTDALRKETNLLKSKLRFREAELSAKRKELADLQEQVQQEGSESSEKERQLQLEAARLKRELDAEKIEAQELRRKLEDNDFEDTVKQIKSEINSLTEEFKQVSSQLTRNTDVSAALADRLLKVEGKLAEEGQSEVKKQVEKIVSFLDRLSFNEDVVNNLKSLLDYYSRVRDNDTFNKVMQQQDTTMQQQRDVLSRLETALSSESSIRQAERDARRSMETAEALVARFIQPGTPGKPNFEERLQRIEKTMEVIQKGVENYKNQQPSSEQLDELARKLKGAPVGMDLSGLDKTSVQSLVSAKLDKLMLTINDRVKEFLSETEERLLVLTRQAQEKLDERLAKMSSVSDSIKKLDATLAEVNFQRLSTIPSSLNRVRDQLNELNEKVTGSIEKAGQFIPVLERASTAGSNFTSDLDKILKRMDTYMDSTEQATGSVLQKIDDEIQGITALLRRETSAQVDRIRRSSDALSNQQDTVTEMERSVQRELDRADQIRGQLTNLRDTLNQDRTEFLNEFQTLVAQGEGVLSSASPVSSRSTSNQDDLIVNLLARMTPGGYRRVTTIKRAIQLLKKIQKNPDANLSRELKNLRDVLDTTYKADRDLSSAIDNNIDIEKALKRFIESDDPDVIYAPRELVEQLARLSDTVASMERRFASVLPQMTAGLGDRSAPLEEETLPREYIENLVYYDVDKEGELVPPSDADGNMGVFVLATDGKLDRTPTYLRGKEQDYELLAYQTTDGRHFLGSFTGSYVQDRTSICIYHV